MLQLLSVTNFFSEIGKSLHSFNSISDVLDILLVTFIIYSAIKLIRDTKAIQLAKGFVLFFLLYILVNLLGMQASDYLFTLVVNNVFLVLIVIFTPEIRHALESIGRSSVFGSNMFGLRGGEAEQKRQQMQSMVNAVCRASSDMSAKKIGALMVFEKQTILGDVIATGTPVDARVTSELVGNIFYPGAPLHDGAAIIRDGRICAAGCILPLTQNHNISSELGTRHRASIGMSEQSDALIVVVSEETGAISIAHKGRLKRNISDGELRAILIENFVKTEEDTERKAKFKNMFRGRRENGTK